MRRCSDWISLSAACNRCKTFFRRTILTMKVLTCQNEKMCKPQGSNVPIRMRCRACRFSRCVEGGMNPLCVGSEVQPDQNPVVQEILKSRADLECSPTPSTSSSEPVMALEMSPRSPELLISRLIDELAFLEKAHDKIRRSRFSPLPEDGIPLAELIRGHSKLAFDYEDMPPAYTMHPPDPRAEADVHWSCAESNSESTVRKTWSCLENHSKVWPHADLVYAIEYMKTFEVFHRLNDDEKLHLVRWVVGICAHLTVSYFSKKMMSKVTYHPDGSTVSLKCVVNSPRMREFHYESIERMRELEMDEKEYVLIKAIIICDPTIDGLSDYSRMMLDDRRTRYAKSLFSYMTAKRGPHNAPVQFLEMLRLIDWFRGVDERRKEFHLLRAAAGMRSKSCVETTEKKPILQDELFL